MAWNTLPPKPTRRELQAAGTELLRQADVQARIDRRSRLNAAANEFLEHGVALPEEFQTTHPSTPAEREARALKYGDVCADKPRRGGSGIGLAAWARLVQASTGHWWASFSRPCSRGWLR